MKDGEECMKPVIIFAKNYTNSINSRVVCQEWNSDTYKNVHRSNIDISTSKKKKQQAALQSS